MRLTYKAVSAPAYMGFDKSTRQIVRATEGESVEVSDEKGEQLLRDYPADWVPSSGVREGAAQVEGDETPSAVEPSEKELTPKKNKMVSKAKKTKKA